MCAIVSSLLLLKIFISYLCLCDLCQHGECSGIVISGHFWEFPSFYFYFYFCLRWPDIIGESRAVAAVTAELQLRPSAPKHTFKRQTVCFSVFSGSRGKFSWNTEKKVLWEAGKITH